MFDFDEINWLYLFISRQSHLEDFLAQPLGVPKDRKKNDLFILIGEDSKLYNSTHGQEFSGKNYHAPVKEIKDLDHEQHFLRRCSSCSISSEILSCVGRVRYCPRSVLVRLS